MYITKNVDVPEDIFNAIRDNNLVVFAGAGVSMVAPSNYPSFEMLAKEVERDTTIFRQHKEGEKAEEIDSYLGRLDNEKVAIHKIVKEKLSKPESRPTSLHYDLFDIFKTLKHCRIVTTNFDNHFSAVISEKCKEEAMEIYYAPALPLGDNFSGLVYLHGSVKLDERRMVLTDADFGKAYLTYGWATRFLHDMFANYTVLFIGYSNKDPIMKYLSTGLLRKKTKRYAFTKKCEVDFIKGLGITPVIYDEYSDIDEAISNLSRLVNMDYLEQDEKIKQIVSFTPPADLDDLDYLKYILNDSVGMRTFCKYAKSTEWLLWISEQKQFNLLFENGLEDNEANLVNYMSFWIAENFLKDYSDCIFSILQKRHQHFNIKVCDIFAYQLRVDKEISTNIIRKWISILMQMYSLGDHVEQLAFLYERYINDDKHIDEDAIYSIAAIFDFITKPKLVLKEDIFRQHLEKEQNIPPFYSTVQINVDEYIIKEIWEKCILPNIEVYIFYVERIIYENILKAYTLLKNFQNYNPYIEVVVDGRRTLLKPQYGYHPEGMDVLIDYAVEIITWSAKNKPLEAITIIDKWQKSKVPILVRTAVYGMHLLDTIDPNEKMLWLVKEKLIFLPYLRLDEVISLIQAVYPVVKSDTRGVLTAEIIGADFRLYHNYLEEKLLEKFRYSWLYTLSQLEPYSEEVNNALAAISTANPEIVTESVLGTKRTWPKAEFKEFRSSVTLEALRQKDLDMDIQFFLEFEDDETAYSRYGFLNNIAQVVSEDFNWGSKLARSLAKKKAWDSDLWGAIYEGWSSASDMSLYDVLQFTREHGAIVKISSSFANFLLEYLKANINNISEDMFCEIKLVIHLVMQASFDYETNAVSSDWLTASINSAGGKLTQCMMLCLHKDLVEGKYIEDSEVYKDFFHMTLNSNSYNAKMAKVILAANLRMLFNADKEWTVDNMIPLFSWSMDKGPLAVWDGFLNWGSWSIGLVEYMLPLFQETFSHIDTCMGSLKTSFCKHLAWLAIYSGVDPVDSGWLNEYLKSVKDETRACLIDNIGRFLREANPKTIDNIWPWIKKYLENRIKNIPNLAESKELSSIVNWAVCMNEHFVEFSELICKITTVSNSENQFYWQLEKSDLIERYPNDVARLLIHLLETVTSRYIANKLLEILPRLKKSNVNSDLLRNLSKKLVELGIEVEQVKEF